MFPESGGICFQTIVSSARQEQGEKGMIGVEIIVHSVDYIHNSLQFLAFLELKNQHAMSKLSSTVTILVIIKQSRKMPGYVLSTLSRQMKCGQ